MSFLYAYLKEKLTGVILFLLCCLVFMSVFYLYGLPVRAAFYPSLICAFIIAVFLFFDFRKAKKKHALMQLLKKLPDDILSALEPYNTIDDENYRELIRLIRDEENSLKNRWNARFADMTDYYTLWVHQIKTPIAAIRLTLQNEDTKMSRQLTDELFRIEQYVEMVLCYLRLDSPSTDYVFKNYDLDGIIKQALHRYAGQFIRKNLKLVYTPLEITVTTDEKWLLFIIEQLLSNAVKYTPDGGTIEIGLKSPATLFIRDTGIGIVPEDLPMIFSKGYTGYNGRADKRASGIGLYLCSRICKNLGHGITAESEIDKGSTFYIDLETYNVVPE